MNRDILISEIMEFCFDFDIIKNKEEIKKEIDKGLWEADFVENMINVVFKITKKGVNVDVEKAKYILLELEKIRLELEYKDYSRV